MVAVPPAPDEPTRPAAEEQYRSRPGRAARGRAEAPLLWRALTRLDRGIVAATGRLDITGSPPEPSPGRPLLLVPNHIGNADALVVLAACHRRGLAPRFLATGGLFDFPVLGTVLRRCGHVRADRGSRHVTAALAVVVETLRRDPRPIVVYPEGRITTEPGMWPERGKTGAARTALATGATVVPVSQWGAHEILPYELPHVATAAEAWTVVRSWLRGVRRRPALRVRFGPAVDLEGLDPGRAGDAARAHARIMRALTAGVARLRADEPERPRHRDPTRPATGKPCPWRE
ncbi:lysophospholipid acyltransferase family protein [Salinifilum aidingensis]